MRGPVAAPANRGHGTLSRHGDGCLRGLAKYRMARGPQVERGAGPRGGARFVVVPSLCYENFPRVIAESFAKGTPVLESNQEPSRNRTRARYGISVSSW